MSAEPIQPREFLSTYVEPAIQLWRDNQNTLHLAIHCIAQIDILAEVVANWTLPPSEEGYAHGRAVRAFRDSLGDREPILAVIRDAHDSHKHGQLHRSNVAHVSGERPGPLKKIGFIIGQTAIGQMSRYSPMGLNLINGSDVEVYPLVADAEAAWKRELARQGL